MEGLWVSLGLIILKLLLFAGLEDRGTFLSVGWLLRNDFRVLVKSKVEPRL